MKFVITELDCTIIRWQKASAHSINRVPIKPSFSNIQNTLSYQINCSFLWLDRLSCPVVWSTNLRSSFSNRRKKIGKSAPREIGQPNLDTEIQKKLLEKFANDPSTSSPKWRVNSSKKKTRMRRWFSNVVQISGWFFPTTFFRERTITTKKV